MALRGTVELGTIETGISCVFTGIQLEQSQHLETIKLIRSDYLRIVKPLSIGKVRRSTPHAEVTRVERHLLRGPIGSMNWRATQLFIAGGAPMHIQVARVEKVVLEDVLKAKKTLRLFEGRGLGRPGVRAHW